MATAEEFAVAGWAHGLTDPYDGSIKPAGVLLGWARHDAYRAFVQTVAISNEVAALSSKMDALIAASEAILAAIQGAEFPVSGTVHIGTT